MDSGRKTKLAASFVVTVTALTGCRKTTVGTDPEVQNGQESAYVNRNGTRCTMSLPEHCPKGVSCNPPAPTEIDCPANLRDAGEPAPPSARPAGKEDWLRVTPHLWASQFGCGYSPERFCAPPPKPHECTTPPATPTLKCTPVLVGDASLASATRWKIESFVYKDGLGTCHKVPAFECTKSDCTADMPAGEPAPCP